MAIARIDSMSGDDAVLRATGQGSDAWFALLDDAGALSWGHTAIARWLADQGVEGWWSQNVAVRYEQARGLRQPGQQADGTFSASASRAAAAGPTATPGDAAGVESAFEAAVAAATNEFDASPRTHRAEGKRPIARWNLPEGGTALVTADPAKGDRVRVTVMFEKLPDSEATAVAKDRGARILDNALPRP